MNLRAKIEKQITAKTNEMAVLEIQLKEARAYVQGLTDILKMLPRDTEKAESSPTQILRRGSETYKVYEALKAARRPLPILEILSAIGKDKSQRASISGALGHYVRKEEIFTRPEPNVFGLREFDQPDIEVSDAGDIPDPPESFGVDTLEENSDTPF